MLPLWCVTSFGLRRRAHPPRQNFKASKVISSALKMLFEVSALLYYRPYISYEKVMQSAQKVGNANNAIMDFFDVVSALLNRFEVFNSVILPQKLSDIFVEILSQLLVVLGVVTKAVQCNRFSKLLVTILVDVT